MPYDGVLLFLPRFLLLLLILTAVNVHSSAPPTERCVYGRFNLTQSHGIICSSPHLRGSTYYHKLDEDEMTADNNNIIMDMIHCEALSTRYQHLDIYHLPSQNGIIKKQLSSGACVINDHSVNCTQAVLYINLTYYDQNNESIIPVGAFTNVEHPNLEVFCLQYLILVADVTTDGSSSMPTGTITEITATNNTKPTDSSHTQPINLGSPGAVYSKAAFSGTTSVLSIIIVILLVALAVLILVFVLYYKKRSWLTIARQHSLATEKPVGSELNTSPPSTKSKPTKKRIGRSTSQIDDSTLEDGEQDPDDHDFGESHELLFKRSVSSPAEFS